MKSVELIIEPDGHTRHLIDPHSERIGEAVGPKVQTFRNSHVESWNDLTVAARGSVLSPEGYEGGSNSVIDPNWFWADMTPVDGPVLGPFDNHETALEHERIWLRKHNIPCPSCFSQTKSIRSEEVDDTDKQPT